MQKLLIYIIAYNAKNHIESVLNAIPHDELTIASDVLISDDFSSDNTSDIVREYQKKYPHKNIKLITQEKNLGYGGNQKFGFNYAIKNNYDLVALIHGDGQYSPKLIPQLILPILENKAEAVLGSRMINKKDALKGGMPVYKFIGNIVLTKMQNLFLGTDLAEFHTGLRAYKISSLKLLPFQYNSDGFSFDTDILIQFIDNKTNIAEIAIPTRYGDEICNVIGMVYAIEVALSTLFSRMQKIGICNYKKFNYTISRS